MSATSTTDAPVENQTADNISDGEAMRMLMQPEAQPTETEETETDAPDAEAETVEEPVAEVAETLDDGEDEEDGVEDLLGDLDDDQRKALAQALVPKRIAELTARAKSAEEQLEQLKTTTDDPFKEEPVVTENPYAELGSFEDLQAKHKEVSELIEWARETLDDNEDEPAESVIHEEGDRSYTKRELRQSLRKAEKAKDVYLPARYREIEATGQRSRLSEAFTEKAKNELPWLSQEDHEWTTAYNNMMQVEALERVREAAPELAPELPWILAHATNSIMGMSKSAEGKPATPSVTGKIPAPRPPATPSASGATPRKGKAAKRRRELESQLQGNNGNLDDHAVVRLLTEMDGIR